MSSPGVHTITVNLDGADRVFDSRNPVTIGRAPEVVLFVDSPLVSRVHATLAWNAAGNGWVLTDNGSTNGVFLDGQRLSHPVTVNRALHVRLGDPNTGPLLGIIPPPAPPVGRTDATMLSGAMPRQQQQQLPPSQQPTALPSQPFPAPRSQPFPAPRSQPFPTQPPAHPGPPPAPFPQQQQANMTRRAGPDQQPPPVRTGGGTGGAASASRLPPGGLTIGRTSENNIVVNDVLASRRHARLVADPGGLAIEDLGSVNGTFVNGARQQRALLREGDLVTIGNVDFLVSGGALLHQERAKTGGVGLALHGVGFTVEGNKQLLVDVSLDAGQGTLTALIGPSGAGKSTLAKLIAGSTSPSAGIVTFEGRNLHVEYEALRSRIGMVPQDDVLHRQLTVQQALRFAAELRLPQDTTPADRDRVIAGVLEELSLTQHAQTRVDRLSGGQRKRASVAMELLTGPSLLILDEPTSGLDPALDKQVMEMLRKLADAGRVVLVVTHSLTHMDLCDKVLLLAPGGKTAFNGPPRNVRNEMRTDDWAEIFARVAAHPDQVFAEYRARHHTPPPPPPPPMPYGYGAHMGAPPAASTAKQISTLVRRQFRLILADRGYLIFLMVLPFVLGALSLLVPGDYGLQQSKPPGHNGQSMQLLTLLTLGATFMGCSLSVRDLVGERSIFQRERAVGLLPHAYLFAKVVVFSIWSMLQSLILVAIVVAGKGAPESSALIPNGVAELYVDITMLACASVVIGLLLSAIARSNEQVMPMLVVVILASLVFCGGMIPVTGRAGLEQISWIFPSRWGFAAIASTVDLRSLYRVAQDDNLWQQESGWWALDILMLFMISLTIAIGTWRMLVLKKK